MVTLTKGKAVVLDGCLTLRFADLVIEEIAEGGPGYPAGSGLTLTLIATGVGGPQRRSVSLLSAGYDSRTEAWFGPVRITLIDVEDPYGATRVNVVAGRVTQRAQAGAPVVAQLSLGQLLALDATTRMELVGKPGTPAVAALFHVDGGVERVDCNDKSAWVWRDRRFTLLDGGLHASTRLSIERLELEPLRGRDGVQSP